MQIHHGILPIIKPYGMVSKDVSRRLQKLLGRGVKMGHGGTLDPLAQGVLPILLGRATKIQDQLHELPKCYEFEIELGVATETADKEGSVIQTMGFDHVTDELVHSVLPEFQGTVVQKPPLYSAVKFQGRPLYDYARKGEKDLIDWSFLSRDVSIYEMKLLSVKPGFLKFLVWCGKGTYIRVLAESIAERLGTCGVVSFLSRTSSGGFHESQGVSLEDLETLWIEKQTLHPYLIPVESHIRKINEELKKEEKR